MFVKDVASVFSRCQRVGIRLSKARSDATETSLFRTVAQSKPFFSLQIWSALRHTIKILYFAEFASVWRASLNWTMLSGYNGDVYKRRNVPMFRAGLCISVFMPSSSPLYCLQGRPVKDPVFKCRREGCSRCSVNYLILRCTVEDGSISIRV